MKKTTMTIAAVLVLAGGAALAAPAAWADGADAKTPLVSLDEKFEAGTGNFKIQHSQIDKAGNWEAFDYYTLTPEEHSPTWRATFTQSEMKTLRKLATSTAFKAESATPTIEPCTVSEETVDFTVTAGGIEVKLSGCWPAERPSDIRMPHTTAAKMIEIMERGHSRS